MYTYEFRHSLLSGNNFNARYNSTVVGIFILCICGDVFCLITSLAICQVLVYTYEFRHSPLSGNSFKARYNSTVVGVFILCICGDVFGVIWLPTGDASDELLGPPIWILGPVTRKKG